MRALSIALSYLLCVQAVLPPHAYAQNPTARLNIVVVAGEGAINNVGQRSSRDPAVRIEDENGKPVAGASVVFTLPTEGPSGEFANGDKTAIVVTDNRGEAAAGLKLNQVPGRLQIHINASFRGQTARTNITQFNMEVPGKRAKGSAKTIVAILAVAGAAAAGGVIASTRGSRSATAPTPAPVPVPITISPVPGTVGPPR